MITKLHFKFEIIFFYLRRQLPFLLLGLALGASAYLFRLPLLSLLKNPKFKTKIIGIEGLYTLKNLPLKVTSLISYGLTTTSENQKFKASPLVKEIYQKDNRTFLFTFHPNLNWHDGKPFLPSDVNQPPPSVSFRPIDQQTLEVTSETDFAPLLSLLEKPLLRRFTLGLGPYRLTDSLFRDGYLSHLYLKPVSLNQSKITFRFYPSESDLVTAFKMGEVDEIEISTLPQEFLSWPQINITPQILSDQKYLAIFLNTEKLFQKPLRQALAYATPKTNDKNERCLGPISPDSWAYNPDIKEYPLDPDHARELFEKNKITSLNLTITDRQLLTLAEAIKKSWQEILDINTTITIGNFNRDTYEAVMAYGQIPSDPDQYLFWHSTQTKNTTRLNNSRIDKLLEEGRLTLDVQERKKIYQDFQRFLLEESPAIFLSYPTIYTVSRVK